MADDKHPGYQYKALSIMLPSAHQVLSGRGGVTGVTELTGTTVFTSRAAVNSGRGASSFCSGCAVTAGLLPDGVVAVTVCTGIVRKFPSARRGSDAATGFASEDRSSFWPSHWPAPSSYRYRMWWRYTQIPYWFRHSRKVIRSPAEE